jgi:membrane protease YdiL (CAAX protease family)
LALLNLAGRSGNVAYLPSVGRVLAALAISVAEEVGWRGYALPRLQPRCGAFGASGIIGIVWTFWHIPMFLGLGVPMDLMLVMLLFFVGGSLTMTWIVNGTRGSLLFAVLAHIGAHLNNSHAALPAETLPVVVHAIVYAGIGAPSSRSVARRSRCWAWSGCGAAATAPSPPRWRGASSPSCCCCW